ncbi:exodeoxyribonuclease VII large subunit [Candidatus Curtissbacteria bacterium RIFCSPLOWO2_01_FULL_41_18]|uniref:Exodeoxyribonuclease 7 large subunit n=1 Tax=Candidatus Curtissbacteria bacterium RIFCSPLOWO2_01_FULL_41_18 TaxID=1797727 RepID=A0A1F5HK46_9BACT|nr:MAG: exodeoxyribonuclease VII large subunit [Candidatus Curtissbacteria bacterium RIFCSPLOWO2_01_FULL_41_18]
MRQQDARKIYSVSEVNYFARLALEQMVFWVEGEISTLKKNPGYNFFYLDLKDDLAILPCIIDGNIISQLASEPFGQYILAFGELSLYEPLGKYQFRIHQIEPAGEGLILKKLHETIARLKKEGIFDQKYKREIPRYPKKVCVVTSYGSDAWNDFKKHTRDKIPFIKLYVADVRVQGPRSIPQLLEILPLVDKGGFDVIAITRGGGSLEDLAAFNNELVARAIFKMKTPTIVAIGHETNESLAEWVADRRASTPTDAANIITQGYVHFLEKLANLKQQLQLRSNYYFSTNFQKLDYNFYQLQRIKTSFKDIPHRLNTLKESLKRHKQLITQADEKLKKVLRDMAMNTKLLIAKNSQKLESAKRTLMALSPKNTLERGYSIVADNSGKIAKSIDSIVVGSTVAVKLVDGSFKSSVKSKVIYDKRSGHS